jgi:hypothetical protein
MIVVGYSKCINFLNQYQSDIRQYFLSLATIGDRAGAYLPVLIEGFN